MDDDCEDEGNQGGLTSSLGLSTIFEDPISFEIMEDAMITPCGHSFSEPSITDWLKKHHHCPICNKMLRRGDILPNYALRTAITKFIAMQKLIEDQQLKLRQKNGADTPTGEISFMASSSDFSTLSPQTPSGTPQFDLKDWGVINVETHNPDEDDIPASNSRLLVETIEARNLVKTDWFGHSAPYCLIDFQSVTKRTKILQRTRDPRWNETFVFTITGDIATSQYDSLRITVWNHERVLKDKFMGCVRVPLKEVVDSLKIVRRFPLERLHERSRKRVQGDILLRVQFLDLKQSYEQSKIERRRLNTMATPSSSSSSNPSSPFTPRIAPQSPSNALVSSPAHYQNVLRASRALSNGDDVIILREAVDILPPNNNARNVIANNSNSNMNVNNSNIQNLNNSINNVSNVHNNVNVDLSSSSNVLNIDIESDSILDLDQNDMDNSGDETRSRRESNSSRTLLAPPPLPPRRSLTPNRPILRGRREKENYGVVGGRRSQEQINNISMNLVPAPLPLPLLPPSPTATVARHSAFVPDNTRVHSQGGASISLSISMPSPQELIDRQIEQDFQLEELEHERENTTIVNNNNNNNHSNNNNNNNNVIDHLSIQVLDPSGSSSGSHPNPRDLFDSDILRGLENVSLSISPPGFNGMACDDNTVASDEVEVGSVSGGGSTVSHDQTSHNFSENYDENEKQDLRDDYDMIDDDVSNTTTSYSIPQNKKNTTHSMEKEKEKVESEKGISTTTSLSNYNDEEDYNENDDVLHLAPPPPLAFVNTSLSSFPPPLSILPPPANLSKPSGHKITTLKPTFPSTHNHNNSNHSSGSSSNISNPAPTNTSKDDKSPRGGKLVSPSPNNVRSLMELGYPQEVAEFSLWLHGDNFEDTLEDLLTNSNEEELPHYLERESNKIIQD